MTGRRWVSEDAVLAEMERLNDQSMALVQEYAALAPEAAEAEVRHKAARARAILQAKANGVRSIAEAEATAEATEHLEDLHLTRLVTAAKADATREALRSLRNNQDSLRTAAASTRDQVTGPGWRGPTHGQHPERRPEYRDRAGNSHFGPA